MDRYHIRQGVKKEEDFLWEMLYQAIFTPEGDQRPSRDILNEPHIAQSLIGWGRKGDTSLIATTSTDTPIGAVWIRLFNDTNKTYGYIDENTPLLGMALLPDYRGKGIGTSLLSEMLKAAKQMGFSRVSLSVDPNNKALQLYTKMGFKKVGVDGTSWNMVVTL
ncbi:GNAT family N-acetyltransferase [Neobacillus drentensis]|uniref:GNAT family N-acetyltransferase n=1 Tax=Neobacillus drentensis TaxID=220684 RepID=UPI003001E2D8